MKYTTRPISDRTAFTSQHVDSRFTASWSTCLEVLERELYQLDATDLVIEADFTESEIRLDGMPRANARAASPAVRLAFTSNVGPLVYATDMFIKPSWRRNGMQQDWQHNVYAVALGLEALRKVDRYGISRRGEQYAGYRAIGAGTGSGSSHMTREDAVFLLDEHTDRDWSANNPEDLRRVYRRARAAAHPDRHGGDRTAWDQVEQAAKVLGLLS